MRHRNPQIESEVFRAYRLTRSGIEKMTDGERHGAFLRLVAEMTIHDQSMVIVEQARRQN